MAQSFGRNSIVVALGDGAVRTINAKISPATWNMALQPNDGNPFGADWDK